MLVIQQYTILKSKNEIAEELKTSFIANMKRFMILNENTQGKENKMRICLEVYTKVNKDLPKLVEETSAVEWIRFAATVFNKTAEFIIDAQTGSWFEIDKELVEKFYIEMYKARNFIMTLIKNNWSLFPTHEEVMKAKEEITLMENSISLRNIPRVNYTGMDTIEPVDEFDGITDIWFDTTIEEDSDYEYEEEEDDE